LAPGIESQPHRNIVGSGDEYRIFERRNVGVCNTDCPLQYSVQTNINKKQNIFFMMYRQKVAKKDKHQS
jgi:hypothetical protein